MNLELRAVNVNLNSSTRELVERAFAFAIGRFGQRIERIRVTLTDENGPRGGVDKRCRVEAKLARSGHVRVEVREAEFEPAVHRAADRLRRGLRDALRPRHESVRGRRRGSVRVQAA